MEPASGNHALAVENRGVSTAPAVDERLAHGEHFHTAIASADQELRAVDVPSGKLNEVR